MTPNETVETLRQAVQSCVSAVNALSRQVSALMAQTDAIRQDVIDVQRAVAQLRRATRIIGGDGIVVSENPDGSKIIDAEPIAPEPLSIPNTIVIRGKRVAITGTPARYIHANVRTQTAEWSTSDTATSPEVEVYDTFNPLEIHLTGF